MEKVYYGPYGHAYYFVGKDLTACPLFADFKLDKENELLVSDFCEPLPKRIEKEIIAYLQS